MKKIDYNQVEIQMLWEPFQKVMKTYAVKKEHITFLFEEMIRKYSARGRYYHTYHHIRFMVSTWEICASKLKDPNAIFLAIIYHDIIYNPQSKDNEVKSQRYFGSKVCPFLKKITLEEALKVSSAILITEHGSAVSDFLLKTDNDFKYMMDFDLSILGTRHESEYEWYRTGVRKEYKMYSDAQYKKGRKAVLENFLKRKKIFLTKEFQQDEKRARKNLRKEIKSYLC